MSNWYRKTYLGKQIAAKSYLRPIGNVYFAAYNNHKANHLLNRVLHTGHADHNMF